MSKKILTKILTAGCALTLFMSSNVFASNLAKIKSDVNLRSYNSTKGQVVGTISKDSTVTIVSNANNGWFQVKTSNGTSGFISTGFMQVTQTDATCISDEANVRTEPSSNASILGKAGNGKVYVTTGKTGDWYIIKYNNTTGYINKQYMQGSLLSYLPNVNIPTTASTATTAKATVNPSTNNVYAVINSETLNLKKEANDDSQSVKSLPSGYNLTVLGYENDWIKVSDDANTTGYVNAKFVSLKNGSKPANTIAKPVATAKASTTKSVTNSKGSQIIEFSKNYIGTPYVWGGTDLNTGVDCSGFVMSCYKQFGINLLRTSREMYTMGTEVSKEDLQPGDLVFFNSGYESQISHVGMYAGDGKYIHSTDGSANGVTISDLYSDYSVKTYVGAKRILN